MIKVFDYSQETLKKYNVNLQEAFTLYYIKQFYNSPYAQLFEIERQKYLKIYYSKICNDNPILPGKEAMRKIIRSLEQKGLIKKWKDNINDSAMFIQITDRCLTYDPHRKKFTGKDKLLKNFIKKQWAELKDCKMQVETFEDEHGNAHLIYRHTYLSLNMIKNNLGLFQHFLFNKLQMTLSELVFNAIDKHIDVLDTGIQLIILASKKYENDFNLLKNMNNLSTNKIIDLSQIFVDNWCEIEESICLSFLDLYHNEIK